MYWDINCTYIPFTVLRATGPKQVKVMYVQFIDPVDNQPSLLFVFYYCPFTSLQLKLYLYVLKIIPIKLEPSGLCHFVAVDWHK